jgi:thioredoxin-dependent peroxiredoxin
LPDQHGRRMCLSDFTGKWVVLYFYPKDNTPFCTIEAKEFSASAGDFAVMGAVIIGLSTDSPKSHCSFRDRHHLAIMLLSDEKHEVASLYGIWKPKKFMGRDFLGVVRSTFLVRPDGRLAYVWHGVSPRGHAAAVRQMLQKLQDNF